MIETDMKKCPFCGGSATIVKREGILGGVAYQPVCNYCKASFYPLNTGHYIKFNGEDNVFVTDRMVIDSIIKEWNSRIGEE